MRELCLLEGRDGGRPLARLLGGGCHGHGKFDVGTWVLGLGKRQIVKSGGLWSNPDKTRRILEGWYMRPVELSDQEECEDLEVRSNWMRVNWGKGPVLILGATLSIRNLCWSNSSLLEDYYMP